MQVSTILGLKREHLQRLASAKSAAGEVAVVQANAQWIRRPKGAGLQAILLALRARGISIKPSSFDAIVVPALLEVDFSNQASVSAALPHLLFVEIKTANQLRVKSGFSE